MVGAGADGSPAHPWRVAARRRLLARLELAKRTGLLIVGHPKSGNTWLRTMLSRLYQVRHGLPASLIVTSDELARRNPAIPRISATNGYYSYEGAVGAALVPDAPDSPLRHKPIVFLARHPCDIAVSWFFQFTKRQSAHKQELINHFIEHPIDRRTIGMWEFVRHSDIGVVSLIDYLNAWERNVAHLPCALVIRYEDLRADPRRTLSKITALMGETFSDQEFEEAVAFGAFENLRNLERQGFFRQGGLTLRNPEDPESFKVRRAKVGVQGLLHRGAGRRAGGPGADPPVADVRLRSARRVRPPGGVMAGGCARLPAWRFEPALRRSRAPRSRWRPGGCGFCSATSPATTPRQAVALALGWPCERRTLHWRPPYALKKPRFRATLDHVDRARSAPLEPPWPDLVLTIGRRPSMAALWIKAQSAGRTRIVLLGKPSGMMDRSISWVAGAEVQLPPRPNLVPIRLPLMRAKASDIEAAARKWRTRLAALPRPLIAILVGGPTVPFAFDLRVADRLRTLAHQIAGAGGTPYVTTSRRTPGQVVEALRAGLPPGAPVRMDAGRPR